ncbi:hypothetical protein NQ315_004204 [Exocentrus adspersus]|uniref:Uncharacterized protein n=1 Tax=Exocentrus adspersus TaxID=1586481 RepID=A0AAV8W7Z2_9CUCU|nr:hypothetical protein NQ315_004204 [Exocentrus adspersus]
MSKVERKEYQETKILRTVSPVRNTRSSTQNLSQFDSNLDYLLEDLQNSVSRPGSSLGHNANTYRETSRSTNTTLDSGIRSNSLNRITNVKSSNPVTEYSSDDAYNYASPDGRERVHGYKKEKYMYGYKSSSNDILPEKTRMQNSINQLDSLLDDLQQVKKSSFTENESYNSTGSDPAFQSSKKTVNRELHYGDTPKSRSRTLERTEREEAMKRDIQYTSEGTYGDLRSIRTTSPSPSSRTSTLSKKTTVKNIHEYPMEVIETVAPDIDPEVLAHLDPNLHPPGNTKVTTTIKTYTYEIPGSGDYPTNLVNSSTEDKYVYSPNQTITTPSKSFVYNKVENKENTVYKQEPSWHTNIEKKYKETVTDNVNYNYPPYQKPPPPGGVVVKETTTRSYQPGYSPELNPPSSNQAFYYKETTTKNMNENGYPQPCPPRQDTYILKESSTNINKTESPRNYPPPGRETYIIKESHNTTVNKNEPPFSERGYPVYNPPDDRSNTTYITKESHHTTNKTVGPPYKNGYLPNEPGKTVIYKHETHTTNTHGPGGPNRPKTPSDVESFDPNNPPYGRKPNEPINVHYSYKSTNTTQNTYKGGYPSNDESQPLLPQKFPTDAPEGPPKKLDELMATIGNEPPNSPLNAGFNAHEQDLVQQKKIDTLKKQSAEVDDAQKKEPVRTKNVSGPPVYYPPGHEMFAKKEESEAAWRAQGGYAKASGKYQYEAESKSKSKSSSGATVVPVCLPLCCGLPCVLL